MRLTNSLRSGIAKAALQHRFDPEEREHEALRVRFAEKLYRHEYGERYPKLAESMPRNWIYYSETLTVHHPDFGYGYVRDKGKEPATLNLSRERAVPGGGEITLTPDHPMYTQACHVAKAGDELRERKAKATEALAALLQTYATAKTLFEAWPEGVKFLPNTEEAAIQKNKSLVPEDLIRKVNAAFGL